MVIFYGASRMLRAAFNLARPFLPFDARMVNNLESALELIAGEKTKRKKPEPLPAGKDTAAEPDASEQVQQYVDELLRFMGGIPWDSEGLNPDRGIGPSHPLSPVFDAMELIKTDMDELLKERTEAEKELRESEDRYRALFANNPIETVIVDRKAIITGYNLAKAQSGGGLPDVNRDVMYKDYAGKHKSDMFEELMECIRSGISKEFPEQEYGNKFLDIRIAPFSEGAIITSINVTERKQAEERIKRLNSVLKAIRNVNQMITVEKDRDSLLQKACNILIEARGYEAAGLGFSLDGKTFATVKGSGFREDISRFSEHLIGGDHPPCIRRIIAEKQKLVIVDNPGECGDCFFKDACAGKEAAIIRVEHADRFYGLLAILFAPDVTADEEEKKELLKEIADDIGIALRGIEMENALIEANQRLTDVINFLPDATLAIDIEGKVVIWNRAIEEMTGVKAADMLGRRNYEYALPFYGVRRPILIDLVFKPDREIEEKYSFVHREGDALLAEAEVPFINGRNSLLWGKASPIYDLQGNVAGAIESIRDITDRKRAEEKLQVSEEKYRNIFENSVEGIFQATPEGKFITANRALAQTLGYGSPEELIETITDIGHQLYVKPEDRLVNMKQIEEHGIIRGVETQFYQKDGGRIWVSLNLRTVHDEKGTLLHYEGLLEDITVRKQAEEKLREEEALKSSILDAIPHAVIGVRERRITFANDGVEAVFGWKPEELIGKDTRILFRTDEEYEEIGRRFYPVLEGHRTHGDEDTYVRRKDGRDIICRETAARIGETLKEKGVVATFEDITDRKRVERELQESEARYRAVFENTGTAMAIIGDDMTISMANAEFEKLSGYSREGKMEKLRRQNMSFALLTGRGILRIYI